MKSMQRTIGMAVAGLAMIGVSAFAATETKTAGVAATGLDWSSPQTINLPKFNSSLGQLTQIDLLFSTQMSLDLNVTNNTADAVEFDYMVDYSNTLIPSAQRGVVFYKDSGYTTKYLNALKTTVQLSDYAVDRDLGAGESQHYVVGDANAFDSNSVSYVDSTNLTKFTGAGNVQIYTKALGSKAWASTIPAGYSMTIDGGSFANATVQAVYTYTPVPEPAALSLLAIAGGLLLRHRRRPAVETSAVTRRSSKRHA